MLQQTGTFVSAMFNITLIARSFTTNEIKIAVLWLPINHNAQTSNSDSCKVSDM